VAINVVWDLSYENMWVVLPILTLRLCRAKYQKNVEAYHNKSSSMKPNIVPNCIRSESYMITFEIEEEKYVWILDLNHVCLFLIFTYSNKIYCTFLGSRYLERNTSWNLPVIFLLKPIAWFIFQVSSGLFLSYDLWKNWHWL